MSNDCSMTDYISEAGIELINGEVGIQVMKGTPSCFYPQRNQMKSRTLKLIVGNDE